MTPFKISIVDDDQLFADLLHQFISAQEEFEVRSPFLTSISFIEAMNQLPTPDLVLLDLRMQKPDGLEVLAILQKEYPQIKVIALSSFYKKSFIGFMLKSGVHAFLPKGISPNQLLDAIHHVLEKGHYFTPDQVDTIREQLSSKNPPLILESVEALSEREIEVLILICQQLTAKEIGERLFITQRTVEGHKNNLLLKTGVKNTAGLVLYAVQNNIIRPEELVLI